MAVTRCNTVYTDSKISLVHHRLLVTGSSAVELEDEVDLIPQRSVITSLCAHNRQSSSPLRYLAAYWFEMSYGHNKRPRELLFIPLLYFT